MKINLPKLHVFARLIAMLVAIPGILCFILLLLYSGALINPWIWPADSLFIGIGCLYFIGLFVGIKWPGPGGFISMSIALLLLFSVGFYSFNVSHILALIMLIPGVLYGLVWYFQMKSRKEIN